MGLGVLDDSHLEHVPGTALLTDVQGINASPLRHAKGSSDILLVPQPSNSPNDPLNWPLWKKDFMLFLICIDTAVVGAWGPMIAPGYTLMAEQFNMSYNALNGGLGWGLFVIAFSCFITQSMAVVWGRRPIFLLGNLLLFISSTWGYFANSYKSLLAARLVGCIGMSAFEVYYSLPRGNSPNIADIHGVMQRGVRLAAWGLCLSVGVGGGTIISGYIIQDLGWNWTYGICAIMYGAWILVLFFFCPETAYRRPSSFDVDLGTEDKITQAIDDRKAEATNVEDIEVGASSTDIVEDKHSYWHDLKIFHGRVCDDSFFKVLARPLMMLIFPQVIFSFVAYGLTSSWLIVVGSMLAELFMAPPYNFSVSGVGLVSISPLIGAIVGAFISGPAADKIITYMSRKNGGVYEPEFRLVIIIVPLILGGMSFFGFGISLQNEDPWIGPVFFYGQQYFSVGFMTIAVYGYLTDCHRDKAPEAFASINLRNIYSFGMNYFVASWISSQGPREVFSIIGGIHIFICLMAIPMYIFEYYHMNPANV
ncbi:Major facilitator superfamily domain, general substrate transporter [Penicillium occitanis (nom. inval.)]|nr:Major facilitator superfamily domain, general substrate transporter [Penicillium occitanis (nom. inval.)]PCH05058.1 hypothetical protein PENOC_030600 [Penicillium occitanis (nom. inval.)]